MNETKTIQVLIVDDHPVSRRGLKGLIDDYPGIEVVGEGKNGVEAVSLHRRLAPNVTVMDLRMPDLDGIAATAAILRDSPNANILILSSYDTDGDLIRAKRAGARGYLLKEADPDEVVAAIRTVATGGTFIPEHLKKRMTDSTTGPSLSSRDLKILALIRDGCSNQEVAESLSLTEGTIRVYLTGLFSRMGVKNRTEAVSVAMASGLLTED